MSKWGYLNLRAGSVFLALSVLVAGCGQSGKDVVPVPATPTGRQGTAKTERQALARYLASLPPRYRNKVVLFDHGRIYSNSDALRKAANYLAPTKDPGVFRDKDGSLIPLCTGSCGTTGVSRRWLSNTSNSDFWDQAQVTLGQPACADTALYQGQSGNVYLGGTSGTGNAIDFGITLTGTGTLSPPSPAPPQAAATFVTYSVSGPVTSQPPGTVHIPFNCGSQQTMTFFVSSSNGIVYLNLNYQGPGVTVSVQVNKAVGTNEFGWSVPCTGCQVKRVTSLAQKQGQTPPKGAYFGILNPWATPLASAPQPNIVWSNAMEQGAGDAAPVNWRGSLTSNGGGDSPAGAETSGLIRASGVSNTGETVGVNETTSIVAHVKKRRKI